MSHSRCHKTRIVRIRDGSVSTVDFGVTKSCTHNEAHDSVTVKAQKFALVLPNSLLAFSTMAYVNTQQSAAESNPMEYSPVTTPEPLFVPSSPDDLPLPVWTSMSIKEAMQLLFVDRDSVPEFTDESMRSLWESDPMVPTYASFAPSWTKLFMKYSLVSGYSTDK
eukprot:2052975-Amphidinium_carterae.1